MKNIKLPMLSTIILFSILSSLSAWSKNSENSKQIEFVTIEKGTFRVGSAHGDWDELPDFKVIISKSFKLAISEVTNDLYEQFDRNHKKYRGKEGTSGQDNDPVVFVSWDDAMAYCEWLSKKNGGPYRLPTEAEWELACKQQPHLFSTKVENWCYDWYGLYTTFTKTDPLGYKSGHLRVTRGGSYRSEQKSLFVSNRSANVAQDRNRVVSFRIVKGALPNGTLLEQKPTRRWAMNVAQKKYDWKPIVDMANPYFAEPIPYVKIMQGIKGPLYSRHNHCPGITYCDNGDILAIWYTTITENGRELAIAGARLRRGNSAWDEADLFWDVPDRNDHAPTVWTEGQGTLFHFNGLAVEGTWRELALFVRTSVMICNTAN
jgi:formylglycine-generating enzyme